VRGLRGRSRFDTPRALGKLLVANAYAVCVIHAPVIVDDAIAPSGLGVHPLLKFALAVVGLPLCFQCAWLVRRLPVASAILQGLTHPLLNAEAGSDRCDRVKPAHSYSPVGLESRTRHADIRRASASREHRRVKRYHRWAGRPLVAIGQVAGATGLFMAWVIPFAGWPERVILGFFGLLFLVATVRGFLRIRAGQVAAHREWMIRPFAIGLAIATDRLIIVAIVVVMLADTTGEPTRAQAEAIAISAFTIAFTLHAVLPEAWTHATRRHGRRPIRGGPCVVAEGTMSGLTPFDS
jgi:hypothetical protein